MKTILITGATSGFGLILTKTLLVQGHTVFASGRNLSERKDIFAQERNSFGRKIIEVDLDVANEKQRNETLATVRSHGRLDVLINNAGYGIFGHLEGCKTEEIRSQFEVNFFGPLFLTKAFLPLLRANKGLIINVSSVFGFMGFPLTSMYCASKFALEGLSESLSHELDPHGVRVVLVQPGSYRTKFHTNSAWNTTEVSEDSPYFLQWKGYRQFRKRLSLKPNPQNPQDVADEIVAIIQQTHPKLRVTFGKDANIARYMRALLPRQFFHLMVRLFVRQKVWLKNRDA